MNEVFIKQSLNSVLQFSWYSRCGRERKKTRSQITNEWESHLYRYKYSSLLLDFVCTLVILQDNSFESCMQGLSVPFLARDWLS